MSIDLLPCVGCKKFGLELSKPSEKCQKRASLDWRVDETYIRVGGNWRHLWHTIDATGSWLVFN